MVTLQKIGKHMPFDDFFVVERQPRIVNLSGNHCLRFLEKMFVVAVGTSECCHCCNGVAATPRSTGTLLIVCARRRKVSQRDARERSYIDTDFHSGRA